MSAGEKATEFRDAGFRVFPLHEIRNGKCQCGFDGCPPEAAGKHPVASNWQHTPHWSDDQWETITEYQMPTGYGVLCDGLIVVDVDIRNGGGASLEKLIADIPEISGAGMVVNTGSGDGSKHYYFKAPSGAALVSKHPDYPGLDFKSSGYVVGPGSLHRSGKTYIVAIGTPDDIDDAPAALVAKIIRPDRHRAEWDGRAIDVSHSDIADMLAHVEPDCDYETWIRCGMAVHDATGGTGFEVWDEWSGRGDKYSADNMQSHWHSFGRSANPVRVGTLIHYAEANGWKMPVELASDQETHAPEPEHEQGAGSRRDGLPCDIAGIDLTAPPGMAGICANWIENQSRRPRKHLAVAGALTALGNIFGMRYTDDRDGVSCNLFAFCVAGSRTGKEAIQQGVAGLHRAAGIAPATHGAIKSEQEIIRNLTRHQMAAYVIDEIGIFLGKIKNAQKSGGAAYLDGVIGMLMQAYSKADGFMLVTGDMKEELRAAMLKDLSQIKKRIEENDGKPGDEARAASVEKALDNLDKGLERPFLSLIGFTTPVTFDELVDFQSATNGFIGRALIFNERDSAPRSKRRFKKQPMPENLELTLKQLYSGGDYDIGVSRVEYYGPRIQIPTADAALDMLDDVTEWFEDQAVKHKSTSGLEALFLGAYELVSKVSLILAVPEGLRTVEHVRWAFALIYRDVQEKARLVIGNDREKDAPKLALRAKIANLIADDGETLGVICNRLRKFKREDIEKALAEMVAAGVASEAEFVAKNGVKSKRYKLNG